MAGKNTKKNNKRGKEMNRKTNKDYWDGIRELKCLILDYFKDDEQIFWRGRNGSKEKCIPIWAVQQCVQDAVRKLRKEA